MPAQEPLARKILSEVEATAVTAHGRGLGAYPHLAVKESIIKAVGGRPPGFRWQGATIEAEVPQSACPQALVEIVAAAASDGGQPAYVRCGLDEALSSWARLRLGASLDAGFRCTGAWMGRGEDELLAVVVVEPQRPSR